MTETQTSRAQSSASSLLSAAWYRNYVLGVLFLTYIVNVIDRSQVLAVNLQSIKLELGVSDSLLGLLGGIPFAIFYSILGIPIAALADRWSRRNVLALAVAVWSAMTALCGMAVNFATLFAARVGVAIGEAGGSPPSHSLISDYFPKAKRATAFSIFALAVPVGTMIGAAFAGWSNVNYGWRATFMIVGLPGVVLALLAWMTIKEPPRGFSDNVDQSVARAKAPSMSEALTYLWRRPSFRHLSLAAALHSVVWYGAGQWNPTFFIRSHGWTAQEAGGWIAIFAGIGGLGTFLGGYAADKFSVVMKDRRWYVWVPGLATLAMVPFQFTAYLASSLPDDRGFVRHHDVSGRGIFRPIVHDDAGARDVAHALGCHVVIVVRPDVDRVWPWAVRPLGGSATTSVRTMGGTRSGTRLWLSASPTSGPPPTTSGPDDRSGKTWRPPKSSRRYEGRANADPEGSALHEFLKHSR